ncbi:FAD/NAD(P)-binding protein [Salinicoccus sesuvii]|uniref:FAD/NAD(P)-binding protein n=1 Tax=Salinicoccus sesuvii TaxID=868281 RepID=A0ABV7N6I3_9STAP
MTHQRIAIVGGGFSGISLLDHLVSNSEYDESLEIDIYDKRSMMGNGHAYQEDSMHLLLNIPTPDMAFGDKAPNFESWLQSNGYATDTYTSRSLFGRYLRSRLDHICASYKNIEVRYAMIEDLQYDSSTRCFALYSEGQKKVYTHVFLTVGQLEYSDPYNLKGITNYIFDPYPVTDNLPRSGEKAIGILGCGLSAIDCIRYLLLETDTQEVHAFSRSGEMPSVRGTYSEITLQFFTSERLHKLVHNDEISLLELKALFVRELAHQGVDWRLFFRRTGNTRQDLQYDLEHPEAVGKLQYLISAANPLFSDIFQYLSHSDKSEFLSKYHPLIEENHSPMPAPVAEGLVEWMDSGKLRIIENINNIDASDGFDVSTADGWQFNMDIIINATGPSVKVQKDDGGVIGSILEHFLASPDEFGGLLVDQNHHIISARTGTVREMFVLGALTYGSNYLSQSVHLLNRSAEKIVKQFYAQTK